MGQVRTLTHLDCVAENGMHDLLIQTEPRLYNPMFYIGVAMFLCGMIGNIHSDKILRNLRKPGEKGYKIPRGGLFEYISGANFAAEILEWIGFAVAANSFASLCFVTFTCTNIGPRARACHSWYLSKFREDYPK